ncbi:MAG: HAD family hydrolase [Planctomycetota bacterium]|jgi:phosphoglycolate phosphatase-like HAD superfamily hydrolase
MLVLFDIDMTLLRSHGVGVRSMQAACRELFDREVTFDGVEIAGRLDSLIWQDVARLNGIDDTEATRERFRSAYGRILAESLEADGAVDLMPGVMALIRDLQTRDALTLGLLTGNFPETGGLKLRAAGLDPAWFPVAAWGSDGSARRDLPAVAMRRFAESTGRAIRPDAVTVIGDTRHDIDCARASGCRSLGVATGYTSLADLDAAGADWAVSDLADTDAIVSWLLEPAKSAIG